MSPTLFIFTSLAMAAIVYFLRAVPFLFGKKLKTSELAQILSRSLPLAIMLLLAAHGVEESAQTYPALIGVVITAVTHLTFRQPIVSIAVGTAAYMILPHFIPAT